MAGGPSRRRGLWRRRRVLLAAGGVAVVLAGAAVSWTLLGGAGAVPAGGNPGVSPDAPVTASTATSATTSDAGPTGTSGGPSSGIPSSGIPSSGDPSSGDPVTTTGDATTPRAGRTIEVRGSDARPGTPIRLRVGDRLVLHLDEQASTGYSWRATSTPAMVTQVGEVTTYPTGAAPGAMGDRAFSYRVLKLGEGVLGFELVRPWESAPAKTVAIALAVRP